MSFCELETSCWRIFCLISAENVGFLKPRLHDTTGCQTGLTTGLTTVLNETATVRSTGCQTGQTGLYNRFDNRLYKRYSRLSDRLSNGFDNRLYRVNGA